MGICPQPRNAPLTTSPHHITAESEKFILRRAGKKVERASGPQLWSGKFYGRVMKKIYLIIIVGLLLSQPIYAATEKSPLKITLVVPELLEHAQRSISKNFNNKPEFHVLVQNISDKPQNIWAEDCSWGYENLAFEMVMDGQSVVINKGPIDLAKNFPKYWTLLSGEYFVFDIYISSSRWDFPKIKEASKTVKLKAIYKNTSSDASVPDVLHFKGKGFWVGQIESEALDVVIYSW